MTSAKAAQRKTAPAQPIDITRCVVCSSVRGHTSANVDRGVCQVHGWCVSLSEGEPLSPENRQRAIREARAILRRRPVWGDRTKWAWWIGYLALNGLESVPESTPWVRR